MPPRDARGPAPGRAPRHHLRAALVAAKHEDAEATVTRFDPPSSYSLTGWELARHVRQLRHMGWQGWEIRCRFDFRRSA
jgi:hypothetical protein